MYSSTIEKRREHRPAHNMGIHMRYRIEEMIKAKCKVRDIAQATGYSVSTIYKELKFGAVEQLTSGFETVKVYKADYAQLVYDTHMKNRSPRDLKIGNDIEFANFVEDKIINERCSPYACLEKAKERFPNKTLVCKSTLYNYIYRGDVFLRLSPKHLPNKGRRHYLAEKDRAYAAKAPAGKSIEERPRDILKRLEFGHWELDSLMGSQTSTKAITVLTERKTRYCVMALLKDHSAESVVEMLDELERQYKDKFLRIFKTITVDNGTEFSDADGMERSRRYKKRQRTQLYYCHPRVPEERGSNENMNKLLRRWIPKGIEMDTLDPKYIQFVQDWINNYPRRLFGGLSAQAMVNKIFDVA